MPLAPLLLLSFACILVCSLPAQAAYSHHACKEIPIPLLNQTYVDSQNSLNTNSASAWEFKVRFIITQQAVQDMGGSEAAVNFAVEASNIAQKEMSKVINPVGSRHLPLRVSLGDVIFASDARIADLTRLDSQKGWVVQNILTHAHNYYNKYFYPNRARKEAPERLSAADVIVFSDNEQHAFMGAYRSVTGTSASAPKCGLAGDQLNHSQSVAWVRYHKPNPSLSYAGYVRALTYMLGAAPRYTSETPFSSHINEPLKTSCKIRDSLPDSFMDKELDKNIIYDAAYYEGDVFNNYALSGCTIKTIQASLGGNWYTARDCPTGQGRMLTQNDGFWSCQEPMARRFVLSNFPWGVKARNQMSYIRFTFKTLNHDYNPSSKSAFFEDLTVNFQLHGGGTLSHAPFIVNGENLGYFRYPGDAIGTSAKNGVSPRFLYRTTGLEKKSSTVLKMIFSSFNMVADAGLRYFQIPLWLDDIQESTSFTATGSFSSTSDNFYFYTTLEVVNAWRQPQTIKWNGHDVQTADNRYQKHGFRTEISVKSLV
eukprot:Nk52_evm15s2367 gene=Nk52_evmTU15s2367